MNQEVVNKTEEKALRHQRLQKKIIALAHGREAMTAEEILLAINLRSRQSTATERSAGLMAITHISDAERAKRYRRKLEDLAGKADTVCRLLAQKLNADSAGRQLADEVYLIRQQLAAEDEFTNRFGKETADVTGN